MYDKLFPPKKILLSNGKVVHKKRSRAPFITILVAIAIYLSAYYTEFSFYTIFTRIHNFFDIIIAMMPPDWGYINHLWKPLMDTIKMSLIGSLIGAVLVLPLAVLASVNIVPNKSTAAIFKVILSLIRTLPTLVTALIATFIFGLGPIAGSIAILIFTVGYVGKLLYEQIENAEMGSFEAMESIGMTRFQAFRYAIFPQVLPSYLSTSLFCFEGNVRYAAILGFVGAGGIGLLLNQDLGWRNYSGVGMTILALVVTVFIIEQISEYFRRKLI
ncbi:phosphonate transport system permease protein [Virgibacillus halotolerans]|uniref:phosphonate ABC transporter, permease protein PhnE n=1 Tax=Virgibacillus halotolerans TaxID=1071053 RepID=UPI0019601ED5|nr:phosphonate ABC transporter, permease protein PhnE [Virgibacillus halotolerans]MBM7601792.1 phosphonate transport system permease protein [Virgibacillus halotolerans]